MAHLEVEPKKKPGWLWPLIALIALALLFLLYKSCSNDDKVALVGKTDSSSIAINTGTGGDWSSVDMDAPHTDYEEISDKDISVRGNGEYAIYSLDETILFDSDKNQIRSAAETKLKSIAASAEKRFAGGQIRIYGYTDSEGSAAHNKDLAQERVEAVQNWLLTNSDISKDRISLNPIGEAKPVATNSTEEGKAQNRRVEIVVRKK